MNPNFTPTIRGFGIVANSQAPAPAITRHAAISPAPVKRPARIFDTTSPFFYPCWVEGQNEARLGYVVVLSYPTVTVNVPGIGILEMPLKKIKFITDPRGKNNAYALLGINGAPCAATMVVASNAQAWRHDDGAQAVNDYQSNEFKGEAA